VSVSIKKSLEILRETFLSLNQDLVTKIENCKNNKTSSFGIASSHEYEYKKFFEVLEHGFKSELLKDLFESMMHIYFFKGCCDLSFSIDRYVEKGVFDKENFLKDGEEVANVMLSVGNVDSFIRKELAILGVKDFLFLDNKKGNEYGEVKDVLNIVKYAKSKKLYVYGDREFIVSKVFGKNELASHDFNLTLNDNIFYTDKTEQIVTMAYNSKPGIYLIANIPNGKKVNLAFYLLIVTDSAAYVIDNNKHSYRDQIYRTKSDGTDGECNWLNRRYEETFFPYVEVLDYFDNISDRKELLPIDSEFSFRSIKKISECSTEVILWLMAFSDQCIQTLEDKDFEANIDRSVAISMFKSFNTDNLNSLTEYKKNIPSLNSLSVEWDSTFVNVRKDHDDNYLVPEIVGLSLDCINTDKIPNGLTSLKQINAHLMFEKRKQEVKKLEEELRCDFLENYEKVISNLSKIINDNSDTIIKIAFKDIRYPYRAGKIFENGIEKGYKIVDASILYDITKYSESISVFKDNHYSRFNHSSSNVVTIGESSYHKTLCKHCESRIGKFRYGLQFFDVEQFAKFLPIEISRNEIPIQMEKYLNQSRTLDTANHLLNDVDPISLIHNPWWTDSINKANNTEIFRNKWEPVFAIQFNICGFCRNKLLT